MPWPVRGRFELISFAWCSVWFRVFYSEGQVTPDLCHFQLFSQNSLLFNFQALDQHWILFWPQNSFLLMSAYLIGWFKIFWNDRVRWLASAKYVRNEPSVGSKLRSLEPSFAKRKQMSHRDDSNGWSDGLFLWTVNSDEWPSFSHWNRLTRPELKFSKISELVCEQCTNYPWYRPWIPAAAHLQKWNEWYRNS